LLSPLAKDLLFFFGLGTENKQEMCIFARKVKKVADTSIFVYEAENGRQVVFYENKVQTDPKVEKNAMILPCPNESNQEIKLFNLEKYHNLFDDLKNCFPEIESPKPKKNSRSLASGLSKSAKLEVFDVGGYKVSIAYNLSDVLKIDTSVFTLPENVADILKEAYSNGFAFVICAFSNKDFKSHPIAFECDKPSKTKLFCPTLHVHGGEDEKKSKEAEWSHIIYSFDSVKTKHGKSLLEDMEEAEKLKNSEEFNVRFPKVSLADVVKKLSESNVSKPKHNNDKLDLVYEKKHGRHINEDVLISQK